MVRQMHRFDTVPRECPPEPFLAAMSDADRLLVTVPPAATAIPTIHHDVTVFIMGTSASMATASGSILAKATDARASARVSHSLTQV